MKPLPPRFDAWDRDVRGEELRTLQASPGIDVLHDLIGAAVDLVLVGTLHAT